MEEVDPLDAFMAGIHEEMNSNKVPEKPKLKVEKYEQDEDDPMDSYLKVRKDPRLALAADALNSGYNSDEEVYAVAKAIDSGQLEYDSDDNPIVSLEKKKIEPLPPLDHSQIEYDSFNKDFYEESPSIAAMSVLDVETYRQSLGIKVSGFDIPKPIKKFEDCSFSSALMNAIKKHGYENPTAIQCQALPIVLCGRDIIGIAKTGSGKTAAFVLPMIVHIMDQPELAKEEGPIGVICAPTRELAQQIYVEAKKFAKPHGIRVSGVFGGMSKYEQCKELKAGCEIVVATPGRLIDMLKMKALTMRRATYLVLDEADNMFDLGFEPQIRSIVGQIRPDRQTLLFSATMPGKVERLAREVLLDPIRVTVGAGAANEDVKQVVHVLPTDAEKMPLLLNMLPQMVDDGDVLVFASTKARVDELESQLKQNSFKVAALHGDKDQASRQEVLQQFKAGVYHVLVASDVAARGLDIKSIKSVVNYDIAKDIDTHIHRVGRTGRAGDKEGVAYTFITHKEARFAGKLANSLIAAGQNVPDELMNFLMKDGHFRARRESRKGSGGRKGSGQGGRGGGGRGIRGVDYGLGIGYNPDATNSSSQPTTTNRGAAVNSLKSGMMSQFRNSFVPASSSSYSSTNSETTNNPTFKRQCLSGFVSGGIIGSEQKSRSESTSGTSIRGFVSAGSLGTHAPSDQGVTVHDREKEKRMQESKANGTSNSQSSNRDNRERPRERRRPSGWDR
eukprot:TRINITY_DN23381_c0_g1_i1.p1 TRINITY_DN23381_c0_g1~~TRINITY_DN23381_c0_g1_i1.p1  ORF type:complete len:856 (+),score=165.40 TRINITY_DN23381_c0_g1_i1:380-2569(+)